MHTLTYLHAPQPPTRKASKEELRCTHNILPSSSPFLFFHVLKPNTCLQYVINASVDRCQPCPAGLKCHGDATFEALTINSSWVQDGNILRLQTCPSGHYVSPPGVRSIDVLQKCVECGTGEECWNSTCVTCSPCAAGFYKASVGSENCIACPANTYRETVGAKELRNCLSCGFKASTFSTGQTTRRACVCDIEYYHVIADAGTEKETLTCQPCPVGAQCANVKECALRTHGLNCSNGRKIVGDWTQDVSG